jgi:hypothetical protein
LELYHKHICPEYAPEESEVTPIKINTATDHPSHQPFTMLELTDVLKRVKDSATSVDNISYTMIRLLPENAMAHLLQLYNSFWNTGCFPEAWKKQKVLPIPKPQKPRSDIGSYRPIALTSCVAKIFDNLIKSRLENFIEKKKQIIPQQFTGFRKGFSTTDSLGYLILL